MGLEHYLPHLPEIERRLEALRPDALVIGLGPSAHLLPLVRPDLLEGIRLFGCNDIWRFFQVHDLVVLDPPTRELAQITDRYAGILASKPERWWIYPPSWRDTIDKETGRLRGQGWIRHLPADQHEKVRELPLHCLDRHRLPDGGFERPALEGDPISHVFSTPTGMTCLAWREGMRRIGLIGVDMLPGQRPICNQWPAVAWFMKHIARQARAKGGSITQLSPFSTIQKEVGWQDPSGFSLVPTCGSTALVQNSP